MNSLIKKGEFSNILANSSAMILNNSQKDIYSQNRIKSPTNKNKGLNDQYNIPTYINKNTSIHVSRENSLSNNTSINQQSYSNQYQPQLQNPFYTPQKPAHKKINYSENLIQLNSDQELTQNKVQSNSKINQVFSSQRRQLIQNNSFTHQNNSNSTILQSSTDAVETQQNTYNFAQRYSNSQKLIDINSTRHHQTQSQLIEPTFFSDRAIKLPRIITTKNSNFKNQIQNEDASDKSHFNQASCPEEEFMPTSTAQKHDGPNQIGQISSQQIKNEEFLKEWLVGNATNNYQPVQTNQIQQLQQNENLPQKIQQSSNNSKLPITEQQRLFGSHHRRYLIRKNSKEILSFVSNFDTSDQLSSSQESILTPQTSQSLIQSQLQNRSIGNSSIFRPQNILQQQDLENQQSSPQRVQIQQKLINQGVSSPNDKVLPSQSALKQILLSSPSQPLFNQHKTEQSFMNQQRALYKPRRNKLQLWMNEVNTELESTQTNDSVVENQNQNNEKNMKMNREINSSDIQQTIIKQYIPSVIESQYRQTRTSSNLPLINESYEKKNSFRRPSVNKSSMLNSIDTKNQSDQNNSPNKDQKRNSQDVGSILENRQVGNSLENRLLINNRQQNNLTEQQQNLKQKISNNLINSYMSRHMSEPKITSFNLSKRQDKQDIQENTFDQLISQKIESKRISLIDSQNDQKDQSSIKTAQVAIKSLNFIPNQFGNKSKDKTNVKSILKNRSEPNLFKYSLKTLESISEVDMDETSQFKQSHVSTKVGFSQTTIGGVSFQRDNVRSQVFEDVQVQRNNQHVKKVIFQEKVSVYDLRTREKSITTISQQQKCSQNEFFKSKQKKEHL